MLRRCDLQFVKFVVILHALYSNNSFIKRAKSIIQIVFFLFCIYCFKVMKRTLDDNNNVLATSTLLSLDGYVVHINAITKNNSNENHH
jgi:hypothetical protein